MPGHALVAFEYGSINGGENSFLAVLQRLRTLDWEFTALVPPDTALSDRLEFEKIPTVPFQHSDDAGVRLSQTEKRANVANAINATRADLVHANSLSMSRLLGPVCREMSVPSLGYLRDIIKISRKAMDDINQLDRIVAVSDATRDFHVQRGLCDERSITIHNGIDEQAFGRTIVPTAATAGSIQNELGIEEDSRLLLSCGQIGMRKGVDIVLLAFADLVADQRPGTTPLHLLIVGERHSQKQEAVDYERSLHATVGRTGLASQVHFLGRRPDIATIMTQSTLLVHAARQEPLGRVLLEAAAVGLPIVATDVGGTREILPSPEFNMCLAPANDAHALAATARNMLGDNKRRSQLAKQLRQRARVNFSVDRCASQLSEQYRQILANHSPARASS